MMTRLLWAGLLVLACGSVLADEWYRWVDESGKVHYGDSPAPGAAGVEKIKSVSTPADSDAGLPYETRRAKQNFPVTLYVTENCGDACQQARDFLRKRGVPFAEKTLKTDEDFIAFKKVSGSDGAPTLAVGKAWLKGFQARQWGDELDVAGYPQASAKP